MAGIGYDLRFVRQMGVEHVVLWTDSSKSSAEYYASRKALFAEHGLSVYGFGNRDVHNQDVIVLVRARDVELGSQILRYVHEARPNRALLCVCCDELCEEAT